MTTHDTTDSYIHTNAYEPHNTVLCEKWWKLSVQLVGGLRKNDTHAKEYNNTTNNNNI